MYVLLAMAFSALPIWVIYDDCGNDNLSSGLRTIFMVALILLLVKWDRDGFADVEADKPSSN